MQKLNLRFCKPTVTRHQPHGQAHRPSAAKADHREEKNSPNEAAMTAVLSRGAIREESLLFSSHQKHRPTYGSVSSGGESGRYAGLSRGCSLGQRGWRQAFDAFRASWLHTAIRVVRC